MIFEDDEGPPRTEPWPPSVLEELSAATARFVRRKVVLDMVDEIPDELMECVGKQLRELIESAVALKVVP